MTQKPSILDQFLDKLRAADVELRCMSSAKTDPDNKYHDLLVYRLRTPHGKHPHAVIVIQSYDKRAEGGHDNGFDAYYPSPHSKIDDEVLYLSQPAPRPADHPNELERRKMAGGHLNAIEHEIIGVLVHDLLQANCRVDVRRDGEYLELERSAIYTDIMKHIGQTGHTTLTFQSGTRKGWVELVHGNDVDVISDYNANNFTETMVKNANDRAIALDELD